MTKDILRAIRFPLLFVLIIVLVHFYSTYYEIQLSHYGVYPRRIDSLRNTLNTYKENARLKAEQFDIAKIIPIYEKLYKSLVS